MKLQPRPRAPKDAPAELSVPMGRDRPEILALLARHAKRAGVSNSDAMRQILEQFTQDALAASQEPESTSPQDRPLLGRWPRMDCRRQPHLPARVREQAQAAGITVPELVRRAVRRFLREKGHRV